MNDDDQPDHSSSGAKGIGDVGFLIDGIDLREADSEDIQSLLFDHESDDDERDFDNSDDGEQSDVQKRAEEATKRMFDDFVNQHSDNAQRDVINSETGNGSSRRLPQLWPEDLIPPDLLPDSSKVKPKNSRKNSSTYQHELMKEYKARASNRRFRITSNRAMYFPQMSFSSGVKYSGTVTLSQIVMIVMLSARNEALRARANEIGCEHLLLGLIENHGFAAGQLLLALHLNGTGRGWALGDLLAKAKKALRAHSTASGTSDAPDFSKGEHLLNRAGTAPDMCFTQEAEQALIESMHVAAQAGYPQVSTKHLLTALLGADSTCVHDMLRDLSIAETEVRDALQLCPESDDSREFVTYFLCSIVHSILRFRLFPGPIKKYKQCSTKKPKSGKKKKS